MENNYLKTKIYAVLRRSSDETLDSALKTRVKEQLLEILYKAKNDIDIVFKEEEERLGDNH